MIFKSFLDIHLSGMGFRYKVVILGAEVGLPRWPRSAMMVIFSRSNLSRFLIYPIVSLYFVRSWLCDSVEESLSFFTHASGDRENGGGAWIRLSRLRWFLRCINFSWSSRDACTSLRVSCGFVLKGLKSENALSNGCTQTLRWRHIYHSRPY